MIEFTRVARHMSSDEVKMKMQMTAGFHKMQKWLVIYNALIDPRPVSEIAKHTGLSESSVHKILSEYNQSGPTSLEPHETVVRQNWSEGKTMSI
jgi:DNA-binding MarR family transcriptional regulator